jgi:hypothetical protein
MAKLPKIPAPSEVIPSYHTDDKVRQYASYNHSYWPQSPFARGWVHIRHSALNWFRRTAAAAHPAQHHW